jgi:hypothetical protein
MNCSVGDRAAAADDEDVKEGIADEECSEDSDDEEDDAIEKREEEDDKEEVMQVPGTMKRPSGLALPVASLASNLFLPTPTQTDSKLIIRYLIVVSESACQSVSQSVS